MFDMKFITLPSGVKFSEIALGAGRLGAADRELVCFAIMDRYAELGGTTFDTARLYSGGNCDIALGKWLKTRDARKNSTIITKGSHPDLQTMFVSRLSQQEIETDLDESLLAIGIDYSDVHIVHRDDVKKPIEEIAESLAYLVTSGKTRAVGVSNWAVPRIVKAIAYAKANNLPPIECSQAHYSLGLTTQHAFGEITQVPVCKIEANWYKESQFPLLAFSSQAKGWFVDNSKPGPNNMYGYYPENIRRSKRLRKLSAETGYSIAALTLAYARDSGLNCVPLCAFSSVSQLEDSLGALKFKLAKEQIKFLEHDEFD